LTTSFNNWQLLATTATTLQQLQLPFIQHNITKSILKSKKNAGIKYCKKQKIMTSSCPIAHDVMGNVKVTTFQYEVPSYRAFFSPTTPDGRLVG